MTLLLKLFGVPSAAAILTAIGSGYLINGIGHLERHVLIGLIATLVALFWLVVTMFYFIATGSQIRQAAQEGLLKVDLYKRTREFKKMLFPWIMTSIVLLIITPIAGAATDAGKAPALYHHILAWAALSFYLMTIKKTFGLARENRAIFTKALIASDPTLGE